MTEQRKAWMRRYMREYAKRADRKAYMKEYARKYFQKNKERLMAQNRKNALKDHEKFKANMRAYSKRPEVRARRADRHAKRMALDPAFRALMNCRTRMWKMIKLQNAVKSAKLGFTKSDLMAHISAKFLHGMTWANYGAWHIDHIIPCDAFDFKNVEEQQKCFSLFNLQPLWARDNIMKANKILTA